MIYLFGWIIAGVVGLVAIFIVACFIVDGKIEDQWGLGADHLEGAAGYGFKDYIGLGIEKEAQYIDFENSKKEKTILPFGQIVQVNFITWEKTIVKPLNPMAEAAVTGLIAGEAMAVAAAIDAKGKTKSEKVKVTDALEIQYHPKGDMRTVKKIIVDPCGRSTGQKWANTLCRCAGLPEPRYIEPQPKGPTYL